MNPATDINLLKAKTALSPTLVVLERHLHIASYVVLVGALSASLFLGVGYVILRSKLGLLISNKQKYVSLIANQSRKEVLLVLIKDRLSVLDKIIASQKNWVVAFDLIARVLGGQPLNSFSVNDEQQVSMSITVFSIEEAISLVDRIALEMHEKKLIRPTLESLRYGTDGSVDLSIVFIPTL
ncbi:hypothetical protein A2973_03090 [Candidatus Gottesmanbacteria bacterium RIFCSPLOWO2_01_FULL_49_10]|uniref:PilN domain-containing protein n=1 Tax=Candidatus Gottesmanbacteria bacterium RIFCSPLOWO2_01_FULL_49_10 TaxID=1798396 RepID=A0A1F6B1C7_9BACT|nr:MAG: hypothetical protein UY10_C0017G0013 [Microgenomates group bacterium GW2011_GWA2_47_8]OGG30731.1 MAG: hypothetical protein A2973_03090 [Candidatus Gottesmanbacteria bacterium RIFCSPLOWO2_01_FULL_49_10]